MQVVQPPGKCWLVGGGPGAMELMTLKSVMLLEKADAVVYDDLAAAEALDRCQAGAEKVYVGKRGGRPSMKQAEIDAVLVRLCLQGKEVVRLKGGCPAMFSRVGSEMRALAAAGVPFELVPGVSSVTSAATLAGFPLTDTADGRTVAVASAHSPHALDWPALRALDTVVLLMGGGQLGALVECMLSHAWAPSTPVAVVKAAGTESQRVWASQLDSIEDATRGEDLSPCVIVLGQVVLLRELADRADDAAAAAAGAAAAAAGCAETHPGDGR